MDLYPAPSVEMLASFTRASEQIACDNLCVYVLPFEQTHTQR